MGCVCCSLSSFVSIILNACERISLCTVCAALVCCILFTIIAVLVMGVGIGFHYCTVQNSVEAMEKAAEAAGALRSAESLQRSPVMRSVNKAVKRGFAHRLGKREQADERMPSNNNTINDIILFGLNNNTLAVKDLNYTVSQRVKRDLTAPKFPGVFAAPNNTMAMNDTVLLQFNQYNDSLTAEYTDDKIEMTNLNITVDTALNNATIKNALLLRQNCTLLNLFARFF